jgi:hypothetical protein
MDGMKATEQGELGASGRERGHGGQWSGAARDGWDFWIPGGPREVPKAQGKRTNGSARRRKEKGDRLHRWEHRGVQVGSVNMAGLSLFKLFLILETHDFDVLCVQETWLKQSGVTLHVPGYVVYE